MRSLGRGMGVLGLQGYLALSQGEATDGEGDGCVIIVTKFFGSWGSIFTPWERQTPDFGNVVARANNTPMPLCCRNHNMAL
jgi:hypothetical protein